MPAATAKAPASAAVFHAFMRNPPFSDYEGETQPVRKRLAESSRPEVSFVTPNGRRSVKTFEFWMISPVRDLM
jgi:hypothetical protein